MKVKGIAYLSIDLLLSLVTIIVDYIFYTCHMAAYGCIPQSGRDVLDYFCHISIYLNYRVNGILGGGLLGLLGGDDLIG